MPDAAADCHMHVLGPFERYPLAAERAYNVPEALLEGHERMKRRVGLERTVLVQASGHGFDNRALLAALAELGERGRGVAVLPPASHPEELHRLHKAGVRGLRLNLVTLGSRHGGDRAQAVRDYERLLEPLGWHLQVFADGAALARLVPGACLVAGRPYAGIARRRRPGSAPSARAARRWSSRSRPATGIRRPPRPPLR